MGTNQINGNDEIEIDLLEVFHVLLKKWWLILGTAAVFGLISMVFTMFFITPQYRSVTKMYVLSRQSEDNLTNTDLQTASLLTKDYVELIKSRTVAENVISSMHLNLSPDELTSKVSVNTPSDARVISIAVIDPDPEMARDLANEVRNQAAQHIQTVMKTEAVNVVDMANTPTGKYSPSIKKNTMMGGLVGFVLSAGIVILLYLLNDTIKTSEDVERYLGLSTLGSIPVLRTEKSGRKHRKTPKNRVKKNKAKKSGVITIRKGSSES